jgi:hypothetical protein
MGGRWRRSLVAVVVLAIALVGLPGGPGPTPSASAVPLPGNPPPHWGQSPYFPTCLEGPCRAVIVIDKTFDPAWSMQLRRWVAWMTYVRTTFNLDLPALAYLGPEHGIGPDPGCGTLDTTITVCKSDGILEGDCGTGTLAVACTNSTRTNGFNHFTQARVSFRARSYDAADHWTLVCGQMGRAIGLSTAQPDAASCMHGPLQLGSGTEKYYATDDWVTLWSIYGHPAPQ